MVALWTTAAIGCTEAADIDTEDTDAVAVPDVAGTYDVTLGAVSGDCAAGATSWIGDALVIAGAADALAFDFGDVVLDGEVDAAFSVSFGGAVETAAGPGEAQGSGVVFEDPDRWVVDADVEVEIAGVDSPCTAETTLRATQVVE